MTSVQDLVGTLRGALAEHGSEQELWGVVIPDGGDAAELGADVPPGVAALLTATDGPYLDHTTQLFSAEELSSQQVTAELAEALQADGTPLAEAATDFFCFGKACENPLLVDTRDQSVWRVPDDGVVWYTGCRLERIADGVEEFFVEWVASPRFQDLAGLTPEDLETNDWYRLLRLAGLAH